MNLNYNALGGRGFAPPKSKVGAAICPPPALGVTSNSWLMSLMFLLLMVVGGKAWGQVSTYTFSQSTGTYVAPASPTVLGSGAALDNSTYNIAAGSLGGFSFTFAGTAYTAFTVSTNGYIGFGSSLMSSSVYAPLSTTTGGNAFAAPYAADLHGVSASTQVSWALEGVAPNRTLIVEWRNFRNWNSPALTGVDLTFQVRLQETTNVVSFVYGTMTYTSTTSKTMQVGLKSGTSTTTGWINRTTTTNWNATTAGASNSATATLSSTVTAPVSGLTFTWTPPAACSGTPTAGTISPASQNVCSGSTPTSLSVSGASSSSGITYQWQQSTDGGSNWVNAVGGSGATTTTYSPPSYTGTPILYRANVTCTTSSLSAVTNSASVSNQVAPTNQASAMTTSSITNTSFTTSWTNGNGNRRVVYVNTVNSFTDPVSGSGPALTASAAYTGSGQQLVYDSTGSSVTITGLTCNTQYFVKVYEYTRCGSAAPFEYYFNTSTGTNTTTATTTMPASASLPVNNNFAGFTGSNLATVFPGWYEALGTAQNTNPSGSTSLWTNASLGGFTTAKVNLFVASRNEWIISPRIPLTADARLSFQAAITDYNSTAADAAGMQGTDDKVRVLISTDGCGQVWTPIYTFQASNTTTLTNVLTSYILNLSAYTGQTVQIAFQATDGPLDEEPDYDFHITDIKVQLIPSCEVPTALAVSGVTNNSANLSWTAASPAPAVGYQWAVTTSATPPASGTSIAGTSTSVSELLPSTTYYLHVRSECSSEFSSWVTSSAFTTQCNPATVPYFQNFESVTTPALPACTSIQNAGTGNNWITASPNANGFTSKVLSYNYNSSNAANAWFFTQGVSLVTGTQYQISYKYGNNSTTYIEKLKVAYGTTASATGMTTTLADHTSITGGVPTTNTVIFTPSSTGVYYFGFNAYSASNQFNLYVDDIAVTYVPVTVTSFTPSTICSADVATTVVTLTGTNFTNATSVTLNGTSTPFTVVNATTITVNLQAGSTAGVFEVSNANTSGVSANPLAITQNPAVGAISNGNATLCVGDTVDMDNPTPAGTWASSNETVATVDGDGIVTAVSGGTATITYTVTDNGCSSSASTTVTVNTPVTSTDPVAQTVVTGSTATFSVTASGSITGYQWLVSTDGGDTFTAVSNGPVYSGATTNTLTLTGTPAQFNENLYMVSVKAAAPCADYESAAAILFVGDTGIETDPSNVTLCSTGTGTATFTVVASGTVNAYSWEEDQGLGFMPISNGSANGLTYSGADTDQLTINGISVANSGWSYRALVEGPANGATSNAAVLTVREGIAFTSQPVNQLICSTGSTTVFSIGTTGDVSSIQWQYSANGTTFTNVANNTPAGVTYAGATTASLNVTNSASTPAVVYYYRAVVNGQAPCGPATSDVATLTVTSPPVAVSPASATYCNPGTAVTLTASGALTYSWSPATGLSATTGESVTASPSVTTTYTVTGTDANGCTNTKAVTVTVSNAVSAAPTASQSVVCPGAAVQLNAGGAQAFTTGAVGSYTFNTTTSPYSSIVGGAGTVAVTLSSMDDAMSAAQTLPFTFSYGGNNFTSVRINTNGWVALGSTVTTTGNYSALGSGSDNNVIAVFNRDLLGTLTTATSYYIQTVGTAPNRITKIQWTAVKSYSDTANPETANFQLWLYETSNVIEMRYGAFATASARTTASTVQVGLRGASSAAANIRSLSNTGSWATPTVGTSSTSTVALGTFSAPLLPDNGRVYRFTPGNTPPFTYAWTSSPAGFTSTSATPTVNPTENTTYTVTVTSAAGCSGTGSVTINTESGATITQQPVAATICQGQNATFTVAATGPGLTYQWRKDGVAITGNASATASTLAINAALPAASGSYDVVVTPACGAAATSNAVAFVVNPTPTVTAPAAQLYCSGATVPALALVGTPSNVTFNITGGASVGLANQTGVTSIPSFTATTGSATISITPVANGCTGTTVSFVINVNETPSALTVTPSSGSVCSAGAPIQLVATGGNALVNRQIGAQSSTTVTAGITPFSSNWEGARMQYLIRASELTAAGISAGNIRSMSFTVTASGSGTFPQTNYTIKMGSTSAIEMGTTYLPTSTTVFTAASVPAPAVGLRTFIFSTPFAWDGTSNIVVEICHDNDTTATCPSCFSSNSTVAANTTAFRSVWGTYADNAQSCGTTTGTTISTYTTRPLITLGVTAQANITWAPQAGLFTDAAGTTAYAGGAASTVYAKPSATTTYTATATGLGSCTSTTQATVNVLTASTYFVDADGDGYGDSLLPTIQACGPTSGYATQSGDCNDQVAAINPGMTEVLYNGVDDNCNGTIDDNNQLLSAVQPSQCGTTLPTINSIIYANNFNNMTAYRFEVTNTVTNAVQVIVRPYRWFSLDMLASYDYATTYSIRVEMQRNNVWLGYYGPACLVSSPAILSEGGAAQINTTQCNSTLPSISSIISSNNVNGSTGYRFRVTNLTDPTAPNQVQVIDRQLRWFNLTMLQTYNYGTTYMIEIAVKTTGAYTPFGAPCMITTPSVPVLENCELVATSASQVISAQNRDKVTSYRFELTNQNTNVVTTIDRPVRWFSFNMIPGYIPGAQYGVRVAVMTSGVYSLYGDACLVTAPGAAKADVKPVITEPFAAVAYPNPFAENFNIDVTTSSTEAITIKVYDMTGRLLETRNIEASDIETQQVGDRYPSGVYNVIVSQGDQVKTLRVVKR